jgi:hypothetical protein
MTLETKHKLPALKNKSSKAHEKRRNKFGSSAKERISEAALIETVRYCEKHQDNPLASLALGSLLSGRTSTQLLSAEQKIELTGTGVAKLHGTWNIARTPILANPDMSVIPVEKPGYVLILEDTAARVLELKNQGVDVDECKKDLKSFLAGIRPSTQERVTPDTLSRVLNFQKHLFKLSNFDVSFIANEEKHVFSQNSYACFDAIKLFTKHADYMAQFVDMSLVRMFIETNVPADLCFGSPRVLTRDSVATFFNCIKVKLQWALLNRFDYENIHHWYSIYVINILQLATLHRPCDNIFRTIDKFDFVSKTVEIQDKPEIHTRILPLGERALSEIHEYVNYLEALQEQVRFDSPHVATELKKSLDGRANLFREWNKEGLLEGFSSLPEVFQGDTNNGSNWCRHFMISKLIDRGVNREAVNMFSGHRMLSEHSHEQTKSATFDDLRSVAAELDDIIADCVPMSVKDMANYMRGVSL